MKKHKHITLAVLVAVFVGACSTKKDTFVSRNWHAFTTKYNVLFNGKEAYAKGIEEINTKYQDDFYKQLPIEPLNLGEEEIKVASFGPGANFGDQGEEEETKKNLTFFETAEEKAVKSIQKHSINIYGRERNSQIDNAYLLLGKARYHTERFIPAIEAFNYIIENYPYADLINETKIWRAKANIRIENEKLAIESLKLLLDVKKGLELKLPARIREEAHTALAMAYIKTDSIEKAKKQLIASVKTQENIDQASRNLYILGQIFSKQGKKDSASLAYRNIINLKNAPKKYKMNAYFGLANNIPKDSTTIGISLELKELFKDIFNKPYFDRVYYNLGIISENNDSIYNAIEFYNKSLKQNSTDIQKSYTYERLGNLYFKNMLYVKASKYYDSVLQVNKDTLDLRIRTVERKYKGLAGLIKNEEIVKQNDSILRLAKLSKPEQRTFFEKYIGKIKKTDEENAQLAENRKNFGGDFNNSSLQTNSKGNWYFYNSKSKSLGTSEFKRIWGNIQLKDNWRWSNSSARIDNNSSEKDEVAENPKYNINTYLSTIPTEKSEIDTLKVHREKALYNLGNIYNEQFNNKKLAIKNFEKLLKLNPRSSFALPASYQLYKLYDEVKDYRKSKQYKIVVLDEYPESIYARLIQNPNLVIKSENQEDTVDEAEDLYREAFTMFKENKFYDTVQRINEIMPTVPNSKLIPKFELLKAYCIGKYASREFYKKAIQKVATKYPNTEEGKMAKTIITKLNTK